MKDLNHRTANRIEALVAKILAAIVAAGFDFCIDEVKQPVRRWRRNKPEFFTTLHEYLRRFSAEIKDGAGGMDAVTKEYPGGNAYYVASALVCLGLRNVLAAGHIGKVVHQLFESVVGRLHWYVSVGSDIPRTLITVCGGERFYEADSRRQMKKINWKSIRKAFFSAFESEQELMQFLRQVQGIALVNRGETPYFEQICLGLVKRIRGLRSDKPFILIDPANMQGLSVKKRIKFLETLTQMEEVFRIILSVDGNECRQITEALGLSKNEPQTAEKANQAAEMIRQRFGLSMVVVHLRRSAGAAWSSSIGHEAGSCANEGFWVQNPDPRGVIGAGDTLNAIVLVMMIVGMEPELAVQAGAAASSFKAKYDRAPELSELVEYLRQFKAAA